MLQHMIHTYRIHKKARTQASWETIRSADIGLAGGPRRRERCNCRESFVVHEFAGASVNYPCGRWERRASAASPGLGSSPRPLRLRLPVIIVHPLSLRTLGHAHSDPPRLEDVHRDARSALGRLFARARPAERTKCLRLDYGQRAGHGTRTRRRRERLTRRVGVVGRRTLARIRRGVTVATR